MMNELLPFYERELLFIRRMAAEFADRYPDRAGALRLDGGVSEDPHVERLIEAFALIAGRIQHKIHDEFPEITEALLDALYPHYLRPVPSMAIVQFQADAEQGVVSGGFPIPRGSMLHSTSNGAACSFRTAFPVRVWPLQVQAGVFQRTSTIPGPLPSNDAPFAIRIQLRAEGNTKLAEMGITELPFHLAGDSQAANTVYELLFQSVTGVLLRTTDEAGKKHSLSLSARALQQIGFKEDEALLPYSERSFQGYRLLQEYFAFPQKFLFFKLTGLDRLRPEMLGNDLEIIIFLRDFQLRERAALLEQAIDRNTFQLFCTPVINLFERCAEPIRITHTRSEYQIIPDIHMPGSTEVYSVERVISVVPYSEEPVQYRPFYSFRHAEDRLSQQTFWYQTRKPATGNGDNGTDVFLSLVNIDFEPATPPVESVTVHITCTNRDMAVRLASRRGWGELELESGALLKVRILSGPTKTFRPSPGRSLQWKLISHLSLNYLSIVERGEDALREMLALYNFADSPALERQILGLTKISSRKKMARVNSEHGFVFCQGIHLDAEFDEEQYAGTGAFLLASVLERFFGLYSGVNSFTQLNVSTRQRKGVVWEWPPRSGEQIVL